MKIQYCSDLHIEFNENRAFLKANPLQPAGDILLLAGDVVPFHLMNKHADFFDFISDRFETTYWVPGNHEYYHYDLARKSGSFKESVRPNVFLVNNHIAQHGQVRLIFSTLWASIGPQHERTIQQGMADFSVIRYNGRRFMPSHFNRLHHESKAFITATLEQAWTGKTMVVTHHVPTFMHYPEQYKGDPLSEAFAVELHDLIEPSGIDYWLFGHHHRNMPPFEIGTTKLITNQLGYVQYGEHQGFEPDKIMTF